MVNLKAVDHCNTIMARILAPNCKQTVLNDQLQYDFIVLCLSANFCWHIKVLVICQAIIQLLYLHFTCNQSNLNLMYRYNILSRSIKAKQSAVFSGQVQTMQWTTGLDYWTELFSLFRQVSVLHSWLHAGHIRLHTGELLLSVLSQEFIIKEGREYPTRTIPCTNALHKVCVLNHRVLSFCINTFRETKDLMIGVNKFVVLCVQISISYHSCEEVPTRNA